MDLEIIGLQTLTSQCHHHLQSGSIMHGAMAGLEAFEGKDESVVLSFTLDLGENPLDLDQATTFTNVYYCQTITSAI
ncbi:hypothetical protein SAMN04244579_04706 [Azotobacter beijerinckii]|uniref:Uncharacterized protein n=1 Tax=Azotobacter beijerinckii TaxID=170623 RepID=A0A1H6ZI56_9GAMM|nr:hypothetical protein SAMN04244579_04706 [Azotobacter beijerinckii]